MTTLSLDLRERILRTYDRGDCTRADVAKLFFVSEAMVKKLLQQRRRTGDIGARHHRSGRKPKILASHRSTLQALVTEKPDLTLKELKKGAALDCSLVAIHLTLAKLDLTFKKRRSMPASRTAQT